MRALTPTSRRSAFRAAVFDLEGTLVDIEAMHHAGHLFAARRAGVTLNRASAIRDLKYFVGGPDEGVAEEIACLSPTKKSAAAILRLSRGYYRRLLSRQKHIRPRRGVVKVLRSVKELGLLVAIASVTQRSEVSMILRRSDLRREFMGAPVVCREDVSQPKPAPDVYVETARQLGILPSEQLVFEDSEGGVQAARSVGADVIALPTVRGARFRERLLRAGAREVLLSWARIDLNAILSHDSMISR